MSPTEFTGVRKVLHVNLGLIDFATVSLAHGLQDSFRQSAYSGPPPKKLYLRGYTGVNFNPFLFTFTPRRLQSTHSEGHTCAGSAIARAAARRRGRDEASTSTRRCVACPRRIDAQDGAPDSVRRSKRRRPSASSRLALLARCLSRRRTRRRSRGCWPRTGRRVRTACRSRTRPTKPERRLLI